MDRSIMSTRLETVSKVAASWYTIQMKVNDKWNDWIKIILPAGNLSGVSQETDGGRIHWWYI